MEPVYRFGGTNSLAFHRDQVINHYADPQHMVPRGSSVAGLLLAVGSEPIPEKFRRGATIPASVAIIDQFGHKYRSPVSLYSYRPARASSRRFEEGAPTWHGTLYLGNRESRSPGGDRASATPVGAKIGECVQFLEGWKTNKRRAVLESPRREERGCPSRLKPRGGAGVMPSFSNPF